MTTTTSGHRNTLAAWHCDRDDPADFQTAALAWLDRVEVPTDRESGGVTSVRIEAHQGSLTLVVTRRASDRPRRARYPLAGDCELPPTRPELHR